MSLKIINSLVSVDWLFENIDHKDLIVLDATIPNISKKEQIDLDKKQIKKAVFFDIKNHFSETNSPFPNTVLSPGKFESQAQRLGINQESCLVVYDDLGIYSSPRVWWLFKLMGFNNIAVLNGGFPAWQEANYPVENQKKNSSKNQLSKGSFIANYQPEKISYTQDILLEVNKNNKIILDARSSGRFFGTEAEPRNEVRSGHIPNSKNLPYEVFIEHGKLKPKAAIIQIFTALNPTNKPMIFSCGSGITASILDFASAIAGYNNTSVYDGSWTEWGSNNQLPIEM
jgi:thiosulfate/3-mercaptopyruvate sulfurtransferase